MAFYRELDKEILIITITIMNMAGWATLAE